NLTLTVTDNGGVSAADQVIVNVHSPFNQPPAANAGPDQSVTDADNNGFEAVTLNGSASSDPDGSIISYVWSYDGAQIATGANPTVTLGLGAHTFTLTVTDNQGAAGTDQVNITVQGPGSGGVTYVFIPIHDAYVKSTSPNLNSGSEQNLRIEDQGNRILHAYLKFNVAGLSGPALNARIRLKVTDGSPDGGTIYPAANEYQGGPTAWTEAGLRYTNAPAITGAALSSLGPVTSGKVVEFDVTAAISGNGVFSFCIQSTSSNLLKFSAKEGSFAPELVVIGPINLPPAVDAGVFQLIDLNETTTAVLNATASDDDLPSPPGTIGFQWEIMQLNPNEPHEVQHPPDPAADGVIFTPNANVLNPTLTFLKAGLYVFRLNVTDGEFIVYDEVQILALGQSLVPGPLSDVPVPGPDNLAAIDPNLSSEIDGNPVPFSDFIIDKAAAIRLGKALFWDMQVGSDGIQACASCHFHAGVDSRVTNELHPGPNDTFDVGPLNHTLTLNDFPYYKLADVNDRTSTVLSDADDITGAQGVLGAIFNDIVPGSAADNTTPIAVDAPFNTGSFNVRRTTGRNAPSAINAVFNFRNFWDGRAFNNFSGVNPFGPRDASAAVVMDTDGPGGASATAVSICIPLSSAASQATGPPLSPTEESGKGRIWPKIGKKLLSAGMIPLSKQLVDPTDSELGSLSSSPANGLNTTYAAMIKAAFNPKWWDSDNIVTFNPDGSIATIEPPPAGPLTSDQYTLIEANASLFFAQAVQCYESILVSDNAPFDQFRSGNANALTAQQQRGLKIFTNVGLDPSVPAGFCINCHFGPEFTAASVSIIGTLEPPQPFEPPGLKETILERMAAALGGGKAELSFVAGDAVGPGAGHQQVPLDFDPRGKLIEIKQASTGTVVFDGAMPGVPGPLPPPPPCTEFILLPLFNTGVITDPLAIATADLNIFIDCSVIFRIEVKKLPTGFYDVFVDGVKRGTLQAVADFVYDLGFYNIGIRPISEDIGNGGNDPFGNPLSFAKMELLQPGRADIRKGVPGGGLGGGQEFTPAIGALGEPPAANAAFKAPSLRNVELTGPYFHNGSQATLRQVIDFYNRGGDFSDQDLATLAPDIQPLMLTEQDKDDLVAFLLSLTDERVRKKSAPFDHPQFFVPDGHDPVSGVTLLAELPSVGAAGGPPIQPFLNGDPFLAKRSALAANGNTQESEKKPVIPEQFGLEQNFPNPFNPSTTIHFALAKNVNIRLEIYNLLGQKVRTLVNDEMPAGLHSVTWNGRNDNDNQVESGVYVYRLQAADFVQTRKMLMVK
ncbi:MAG: cytochrome c peroxidase, partial [bacterium]